LIFSFSGLRRRTPGPFSSIKSNLVRSADGAREIMKDIHHVRTEADRSGDLTGISAAIRRYVVADNQASEAVKKMDEANAPNELAESIRQFRIWHGLETSGQ
jgi:hypothetical protein